jgi:hypothetical protein
VLRSSPNDSFLSVCGFGNELIATEDLDPVYCAIARAPIEGDQLARLLIGYAFFYDLGIAAWLSEREHFWDAALEAVRNETPSPLGGRWPRGTERRHFRGQKAINAIETLAHRYTPTQMVERLKLARELKAVIEIVTNWPQCGPWIAFKLADLMERVVRSPVAFPRDVCLLYREPRAGLQLIAQRMGWSPMRTLAELERHFQRLLAPPNNDRPCSVQEVETILCKFKASLSGSYWIGRDIHEVRKALNGWGPTATKMLAAMPPVRSSRAD